MGGDSVRARRKEHILVQLRRLLPGASFPLNAMQGLDSSVAAVPAKMADILKDHWSKIFTRQAVDPNLLQDWLREVFPRWHAGAVSGGLEAQSGSRWAITRDSIHEAVDQSGNTMPGPD